MSRSTRGLRVLFAGVILCTACAGRGPAATADAPEPAPAPRKTTAPDGPSADAGPPLFSDREPGWKAADADTRRRARALADAYAGYLATARTPRRAVGTLIEGYRDGATELEPGARPEAGPGTRYWFAGPGGDAAAFVRVGSEPIERGMRIVVAAVDAPRIDLKQKPVYREGEVIMLETYVHGPLRLRSWLSHPLALHIHAARPGAAAGSIDVVVGDDADEPVLLIPDLLPHLSQHVQGRTIVDSPERMDAIAARSLAGLRAFLDDRGLDDGVFADAEVSLVPAGTPSFVGVDRALLSGYGHGHRAMAYAAVRALVDADTPRHTALVVAVSKNQIAGAGSSGLAFVEPALTRVVAALSETGSPDALDVGRVLSRSAALTTRRLDGERNHGIAIDPAGSDAMPRGARRAIDAMRRAGAAVQVVDDATWTSPARQLSTLNLDAVDVAIPTTGRGAPRELLSTLDLYQAYLGCTGWLTD